MYKPTFFFAFVVARNDDYSTLPMMKQKWMKKSPTRKRNTRTRVSEAKRKLRNRLFYLFSSFCETNICIWHIDVGFVN